MTWHLHSLVRKGTEKSPHTVQTRGHWKRTQFQPHWRKGYYRISIDWFTVQLPDHWLTLCEPHNLHIESKNRAPQAFQQTQRSLTSWSIELWTWLLLRVNKGLSDWPLHGSWPSWVEWLAFMRGWPLRAWMAFQSSRVWLASWAWLAWARWRPACVHEQYHVSMNGTQWLRQRSYVCERYSMSAKSTLINRGNLWPEMVPCVHETNTFQWSYSLKASWRQREKKASCIREIVMLEVRLDWSCW